MIGSKIQQEKKILNAKVSKILLSDLFEYSEREDLINLITHSVDR